MERYRATSTSLTRDMEILMKNFVVKLYRRIAWTLDRGYRHSRVRNAILALRSRKKTEQLFSDCKRFVIFLVAGIDTVDGGVMSICSIASETEKLFAGKKVSVAVCTAYSEPRILRYTKFDNDVDILAFADLLSRFPPGSDVLVHVPEILVQKCVSECASIYLSRSDLNWRFNILLQIDRMPEREAVEIMKQIGPTTVTLAYKAMAVEAERRLGCPTHFLSWFISPEDFERREYFDKKPLIIISPDPDPLKSEIVRRMAETLPDHEIIEIWNMTYEKYKSIIKDAKFAFTFGEGLDGYFAETIFCGGVGMAWFDDRYFTPEFRNLDGVFQDSKHALSSVAEFLKTTNNEVRYRAVADAQYQLVARTFDRKEYLDNIKTFYEKYFMDSASKHSDVDEGTGADSASDRILLQTGKFGTLAHFPNHSRLLPSISKVLVIINRLAKSYDQSGHCPTRQSSDGFGGGARKACCGCSSCNRAWFLCTRPRSRRIRAADGNPTWCIRNCRSSVWY